MKYAANINKTNKIVYKMTARLIVATCAADLYTNSNNWSMKNAMKFFLYTTTLLVRSIAT